MRPMFLALGAAASVLLPTAHGQTDTEQGPVSRARPHAPLPEIQRGVPPTGGVVPERHAPASTGIPRQRATQDGAIDATAIIPFDRHATVYYDVTGGTHWARGRTYKASADASGFSYIPFLGSDAPRNFPVHFRLARVERDGVTFQLTDTADVHRVGDRMVLDRGGVEVRYDFAPESVEQSFAFARPLGSGDVTLHLEVTSELAASMEGGALRFANDLGSANYGEAIVLDGTGRQAAVASRWDGGSIELTVPGTFVDTAVGPIVVDPLLTTTTIDEFSDDLLNPDLAYDAVEDRYLAVYEEQFSGTDFDVYAQFVDATTLNATLGRYIELGSARWTGPKVAQQFNSRRFLVVAQADSIVVAGSTDIAARFCEADGTLEDAFVLKGATAAYTCEAPDIGSERIDLVGSYYCVVYNRDYGTDRDVAAIIVDTAGNYHTGEITLGGFVSRDEGVPAVSKSTMTGATRYIVAWPVEDLNSGDFGVQAVQVSFSGSTTYGPFFVEPFVGGTEYFDVEVSGLSARNNPGTGQQYYAISYDDSPSAVTDAFIALCSAQTVHSIEELQVIEHATKNVNDDNVVIATLADHFIFGYVSDGTLNVTIAQPIDGRLGLTERRLTRSDANPSPGTLAVASPYSGGADFRDCTFLWSEWDGADYDIEGVYAFAAVGVEASGTQYCYGVQNSSGDRAFIQAFGDRSRFSTQTLSVSSVPLNTFGFFLASTASGLTPNAGGSQGTLCLGGNIGRFGIYNSGSSGTGEFLLNPQAIAQPTGTAAALAGQTWCFQSWHRDSVGGSATSNFSNAVAIPFL
ncbi:MAG: hypothetical protein AAF726_21760 [Planctomycetota bacterium]